MASLAQLLSGGNLRTIGASNAVVQKIKNQQDFDALFGLVAHPNRALAMRSMDAVEKVSRTHPQFLVPHTRTVMHLLHTAVQKEIKWHLAQLLSRLPLSGAETAECWCVLQGWVLNKGESRIVRVNALQALHDLLPQVPLFKKTWTEIVVALKQENVPSLMARMRKLEVV